jgi:hypothetical protein
VVLSCATARDTGITGVVCLSISLSTKPRRQICSRNRQSPPLIVGKERERERRKRELSQKPISRSLAFKPILACCAPQSHDLFLCCLPPPGRSRINERDRLRHRHARMPFPRSLFILLYLNSQSREPWLFPFNDGMEGCACVCSFFFWNIQR